MPVDFVQVRPIARAYLESYLFTAVANQERAHFTRSFGIRSHTALPTIRVWNHQKKYWRVRLRAMFTRVRQLARLL